LIASALRPALSEISSESQGFSRVVSATLLSTKTLNFSADIIGCVASVPVGTVAGA
jgi:hypothetical protein